MIGKAKCHYRKSKISFNLTTVPRNFALTKARENREIHSFNAMIVLWGYGMFGLLIK